MDSARKTCPFSTYVLKNYRPSHQNQLKQSKFLFISPFSFISFSLIPCSFTFLGKFLNFGPSSMHFKTKNFKKLNFIFFGIFLVKEFQYPPRPLRHLLIFVRKQAIFWENLQYLHFSIYLRHPNRKDIQLETTLHYVQKRFEASFMDKIV